MVSRLIIRLPLDLIRKCESWAEQVVADYRNGHSAASRAVTCFDAHINVRLQAHAKMAECAFALALNLDPSSVLSWDRKPDRGADLTVGGWKFDVKHTGPDRLYLIWPLGKNHIFETKDFSAMVLVRGEPPLFEMTGWISKDKFRREKKIAGEGHRLAVGTWHVGIADLADFDDLQRFVAPF